MAIGGALGSHRGHKAPIAAQSLPGVPLGLYSALVTFSSPLVRHAVQTDGPEPEAASVGKVNGRGHGQRPFLGQVEGKGERKARDEHKAH